MPTLGQTYTREEINQLVGGGDLQSYLPFSGGTVLCGCFDPALNVRAPFEIDVGAGPNITHYAQVLVKQGNSVPVFLKQTTHAWEFIGNFRGIKYSIDSSDLYPNKLRRQDAIAVLYLQPDLRQPEESADVEGGTTQAMEGRLDLVKHYRRERSRLLLEAKRRAQRAVFGHLKCEACGLTESDLIPRALGTACFEVHHLVPLSTHQAEAPTFLDDLAVLCANCHRMVHSVQPILTIDALQKMRTDA